MNRQEHLDWCKARALAYVGGGDLHQALTSMFSDLNKHEETKGHAGIKLGAMLLFSGNLQTEKQIRDFINGFN